LRFNLVQIKVAASIWACPGGASRSGVILSRQLVTRITIVTVIDVMPSEIVMSNSSSPVQLLGGV
jgi:hypothetical protein